MWGLTCPASFSAPFRNVPAMDIQAQEGIEFFLEKKYCVAKGNVRIKQGETTILCQKIKIFFRSAGLSKSPEIKYIVATGKAIVYRGANELKADRLVFYVKDQKLLAQSYFDFGVNLFQRERDFSMQARELRYDLNSQKGIATGGAILTHPKGRFRSNEICFSFSKKSPQPLKILAGLENLNKDSKFLVQAKGNVAMMYEDWKIISKEAFYDEAGEKLQLLGAVQVSNGTQNFGTTHHAILDLKKRFYKIKALKKRSCILMIPVHQTLSFKKFKRK
ncbi:lipopolysaccharide transport periplasmic protein LptA [Holospora elegans E1]|uniref:Lipopolysaccharide transport periplasmic protein LptA n=1 Tax=Holospora elegans E1 TaxID=1427503 RepID=A0A023E0Z9_9PROT|nr:lipopolysaccharide transport periplasmic protein LptA [Holospora elegans E1]